MKKNILRILMCILISLLIISTVTCISSFATGNDRFDTSKFESKPGSDDLNNAVKKFAMTAILTVKVAAIAIAVIILLIIGMKYMISSAGDRADIKKHAVPYVIGVIILFGVSGILTLIQKIAGVFD